MTAGSIAVPTIIPLRPPEPGKPKHIVDSSTRIEIKSDSNNVDIYYTIDGSKPEPYAPLGMDRSTFKYRGPFTLPSGKQTVKALATSKDGIRQSNVNTKIFEVEFVDLPVPLVIEDDAKTFKKDLVQQNNKSRSAQSYRNAWEHDVDKLDAHLTDMSVRGSHKLAARDSARFTNTRFSQHDSSTLRDDDLELTRRAPPNPYKQTEKLQKQTDYLRCIHCYSERPSDPYARFCQTCGKPVPPLPSHRLSPPDPGEMGRCNFCNSTVPLNTSTCVVCEASIPSQNQPQMSLKLSESKLCQYCGTGNPANVMKCLLCEASLPERSKPVNLSTVPPIPRYTTGSDRECSVCHRVNDANARFCDWCGAKPSLQGSPMTCSRCGAANNLYAAFCASCGLSISAPMRETNAYWSAAPERQRKPEPTPKTTQVIIQQPKKPEMVNSFSQTVGLYYPSEKELQKKRQEEEEKWALEKEMRDRKPLLTSISPGRGYWRKQLEHICLHLKAEAQNNPEFRALVGEPRMGKLTAVSVHEDGLEVTLTASYALRMNKEPFTIHPYSGSMVLSDITQRRKHMDSESSEESDEHDSVVSEVNEKPAEKTRKKSKKKSKKKESNLSPEDRKLLKEVGKNGEGRAEEVHELINEGATPLVCSSQGTPALVMATINKHTECLPVLLDSGADVNSQDKETGNTALHEAVNAGYEGKEMIDILLSHGASLVIKNHKGQTVHDLAVRIKNETAIKTLTACLGQTNLDKISKPSKGSKVKLF